MLSNVQIKLTEFSDFITRYATDFVRHEWLVEEVNSLLEDPSDCRFVILTDAPCERKTAFLAHLVTPIPNGRVTSCTAIVESKQ